MPSSFGQYQSGIEASTENLVKAYALMAKDTQDTLNGIGQTLGSAIAQYGKEQQYRNLNEAMENSPSFNQVEHFVKTGVTSYDKNKTWNKNIDDAWTQYSAWSLNNQKVASESGGTFEGLNEDVFRGQYSGFLKNSLKNSKDLNDYEKSVLFEQIDLANKQKQDSLSADLIKKYSSEKRSQQDVYAISPDSLSGYSANMVEPMAQDEQDKKKLYTDLLAGFSNQKAQEPREFDFSTLSLNQLLNKYPDKNAPVKNAITETEINNLNSKLEEEKLKLEKLKKLKESGDYVPSGTPTKALQLMSDFGTPFSNSGKENAILLIADRYKKLGKEITPEVSKEIIDTVEKGGFISELGGNVAKLTETALFSNPLLAGAGMLASSQLPQLKQKEINSLTSEFKIKNAEKYAGENIVGGGGVSKDIEKQIEDKTKYVNLLENKQKENKPATPKDSVVTFSEENTGKLDAGKFIVQQKMDRIQKKESMRQYYEKVYGAVPISFDTFFDERNPEPQIVNYNGRELLRDKDGNWKELSQPKRMTTEEISKERMFSFGLNNENGDRIRDKNGNFVPVEIAKGSGIFVSGNITGTPEVVAKIRDNVSSNAEALAIIKNELLPLFDVGGVRINPKWKDKIIPIQTKLKAKLRPEAIGSGSVSIYEQEQLKEAIADPTKFWQFFGGEKAKAEMMIKVLEDGLQNEATKGEFKLMNLNKGSGTDLSRALNIVEKRRNPQK